jgi:O-antigen ligase/polysaccharide polymerase Wzy-like membrane protein
LATLDTHVLRASRPVEPLGAAYFWLVLFFVVYCTRPQDWIPGLVNFPLAKITGFFVFAAFAASVAVSRRGVLSLPREIVCLVLLLGQLSLAAISSPVWRGGAVQCVLDFWKVVPIVIVIAITVKSMARFRKLVFVQAASVMVISIVTVWKGRLPGGRLEGALSGIYENPNDLALAIVLTFPLCFAFLLRSRSAFRKVIWSGSMLLMTYAVLLTASRAGLLALMVTVGACLWEFGMKGRRPYLIPLAVLAGIVILPLAGGYLVKRFESTFESDRSTQTDVAARESAEQRRALIIRSLVITAEHPLFGVGPGNFEIVSGNWHVTHNTFSQLSAEGGLLALILYLIIIWQTFSNLRRTQQLANKDTDLMLWAGTLRASLYGFLIGSFFASLAYQFFPYFLVAYATALAGLAAADANPLLGVPRQTMNEMRRNEGRRGISPSQPGIRYRV